MVLALLKKRHPILLLTLALQVIALGLLVNLVVVQGVQDMDGGRDEAVMDKLQRMEEKLLSVLDAADGRGDYTTNDNEYGLSATDRERIQRLLREQHAGEVIQIVPESRKRIDLPVRTIKRAVPLMQIEDDNHLHAELDRPLTGNDRRKLIEELERAVRASDTWHDVIVTTLEQIDEIWTEAWREE